MKALTYLECAAKLKTGDRVVFVTSHDIFAEGVIVPEGMTGVVVKNNLNEISPSLWIKPDDAAIQEKLKEWDGNIQITPYGDADSDWQEESTIARLT